MKTSKLISQEHSARLSALMDNEASEQDIDALLAVMSENEAQQEAFTEQLAHYSAQQQGFRSDRGLIETSSLIANVRQAIIEEETLERSAKVVSLQQVAESSEKQSVSTKWAVASGFAVAASVAFVVVLTGNVLLAPSDQSPTLAETFKSDENVTQELVAQSQADDLSINSARLQSYLRAHTEEATQTVGQGMIPMARVVNFTLKKDSEGE
ncbi:sigma-E factor negative regulatory protein [Marinomonas epiphytica]